MNTRPVFLVGLLAAAATVPAWPQDKAADALSGYTSFDFEADNARGGFDGTIDRMEGNVRITLKSDDPELEPLPISADKVTFVYDDEDRSMPQKITLIGHAVIEHPSTTMKAEHAEWDFATGIIVLTGNPYIDSETMRGVSAEEIRINIEEGTWEMQKGRAKEISLAARPKAAPDPSLLTQDDLKDWTAFLTAFRKDCVAQQPTPGNHILALFDPEAKALIGAMTVEDLLELKEKFVDKMNDALALPGFYDAAAWQAAVIPEEAASLIAARAERELAPEERTRMNRLLLEGAYPGQIQPVAQAPNTQ